MKDLVPMAVLHTTQQKHFSCHWRALYSIFLLPSTLLASPRRHFFSRLHSNLSPAARLLRIACSSLDTSFTSSSFGNSFLSSVLSSVLFLSSLLIFSLSLSAAFFPAESFLEFSDLTSSLVWSLESFDSNFKSIIFCCNDSDML